MTKVGICMSVVGLLLPCAAQAQIESKPATFAGDPAEAFGVENYPPEARQAGEQGRVVVEISVGADGRPTGCTVMSGRSTSLDATTCTLAMTKVRYVPARDRSGKALPGKITLPVRWTLADLNVDSETTTIDVTADNAIVSCRSTSNNPKSTNDGCDLFAGSTPDLLRMLKGRFAAVAATLTVRNTIAIDGGNDTSADIASLDGEVVGYGRAAFAIDKDGAITDCRVLQTGGKLGPPPLCEGLSGIVRTLIGPKIETFTTSVVAKAMDGERAMTPP